MPLSRRGEGHVWQKLGAELPSAATGAILTSMPADPTFAQSVFANGLLFTASGSGVTAWAPAAG